jgi:hypothetical protein
MIMSAATGDWTRNMATEEYPAVRAIYDLFDKAANVEMYFQDAPHNYNKPNREATYAFFGKHVLGETDASRLKEKNVQMEKLQDMLVLHNRTLPANALFLRAIIRRVEAPRTGTDFRPAATSYRGAGNGMA